MPDSTNQSTVLQSPPPIGDSAKAQKYITKLVEFIDQDKINIYHTDLSLFDPTSLQDHYRVDLDHYQIEVSHSKQPSDGADSFVILFNNLKVVAQNCTEKAILAYMHLTPQQFHAFKLSADGQLKRIKKQEEEKRLNQALAPIDQLMETIDNDSQPHQDQSPQPNHKEPLEPAEETPLNSFNRSQTALIA